MKIKKLFILLIFISHFCLCQSLKEEDFFLIFENYYFPSQIYFDIEEEKEFTMQTLKKVEQFPIELKYSEITVQKGKFKIQKDSAFYLRVCYLEHLISDNGLIITISEKSKKYKIIPDKSWNYFKKTSGLPLPYYLNCYYRIPQEIEGKINTKEKLLKAKKKKKFCNEDFCYDIVFEFYLDNNPEFVLENNKKIIFKILNVKENAPFSNKKIWEIYGIIIKEK